MSQFTDVFLQFIDGWGYYAVAILMALENACIPIPSELILGFAGYMIYAGRMTFTMAMVAGMVGGMLGSYFAYYVGHYGGRPFVDKYGIKAVFFSRMLPVVRTFISLPAGFAHVDMKKFFFYTFIGSLPWTALILFIGMMLGEGWKVMMEVGHEISLAVAAAIVIICIVLYVQYKRKKKKRVH